jgi:hypothetical protein
MATAKKKPAPAQGFIVPTYQALMALFLSLGFVWRDEGNYALNLIGIRSASDEPNVFNDYLLVAFKLMGFEHVFCWPITTDPGLYYRHNPANVLGAAFVKRGQYIDLWKLGLHQGKYPALVQAKPITVWRDNDKDHEMDETNTQTGIFGINLHRASETLISSIVDKWSAGCQVMPCPLEYKLFIQLCYKAAEIHGNAFTYTLLDEADLIGK